MTFARIKRIVYELIYVFFNAFIIAFVLGVFGYAVLDHLGQVERFIATLGDVPVIGVGFGFVSIIVVGWLALETRKY